MARGIRTFDFNSDGTVARHDIRLDSSGNMATVDALNEVQDRVSSSILLYQGEDVWDLNFGIDYQALAELSPLDRSQIPAAILSHVLAREGVRSAEILRESIDPETRVFSLAIRITTEHGQTTIQT